LVAAEETRLLMLKDGYLQVQGVNASLHPLQGKSMAVKSDQVILVWTEEIIFNELWSAVDQMPLTIEVCI